MKKLLRKPFCRGEDSKASTFCEKACKDRVLYGDRGKFLIPRRTDTGRLNCGRNVGRIMFSRSGEGYIDIVVLVLVMMMVLALMIKVLPVFITKIQLDNFADELIREAEISGRIGSETNARYNRLSEKMGFKPNVSWSESGRIQLNHEVTVTLTYDMDIGLFGLFGSFPVHLQSRASGKSEVYWK